MKQYYSHNDLPSNIKAVSINILNARLADAIDLALLTKQRIGTSRDRILSPCTR